MTTIGEQIRNLQLANRGLIGHSDPPRRRPTLKIDFRLAPALRNAGYDVPSPRSGSRTVSLDVPTIRKE